MKRQTICAAVFLLINTYTHAQPPSTPESFVSQIQKNSSRLDGWTKIYTNERGYYKIRAHAPNAQTIDVVRTESVLRPYLGKLHFFVSLARAQEVESKELAEHSNAYSEGGSLTTHECHLDFSPGKVSWELTRIRCHAIGIGRMREFEKSEILDSPLGDVIMTLEAPASNLNPKKSPNKKAI